MRIDCAWAENIFVTKANIIHKNVHNAHIKYSSKTKKVYSAVQVYNDNPEYNLYGVIDNLEVLHCKDGDYVNSDGIKCKINIVEYKPTKPKNKDYNYEDLMQIFSQKICVDYVLSCKSEAQIYYSDVNKRVDLPMEKNYDEYDKALKEILANISYYMSKGKIPPKKESQKCNGCSMVDLCMPVHRKKYNLLKEIDNIERQEKLEGDMR